MREELSDTFRQALDAAQSAARELNQDFVGTEHLMLGLLETAPDGEAAKVLHAAHAEPMAVSAALRAALPVGDHPPVVTGNLPLSPKAQRIVNGAIVKAQAMRETRVSTRFLLLSLLDEPQTAARHALDTVGADVEAMLRKLAEKPATAEA
jgi:ATP-dependent Clp protease ATP-binding subunit ClpC